SLNNSNTQLAKRLSHEREQANKSLRESVKQFGERQSQERRQFETRLSQEREQFETRRQDELVYPRSKAQRDEFIDIINRLSNAESRAVRANAALRLAEAAILPEASLLFSSHRSLQIERKPQN